MKRHLMITGSNPKVVNDFNAISANMQKKTTEKVESSFAFVDLFAGTGGLDKSILSDLNELDNLEFHLEGSKREIILNSYDIQSMREAVGHEAMMFNMPGGCIPIFECKYDSPTSGKSLNLGAAWHCPDLRISELLYKVFDEAGFSIILTNFHHFHDGFTYNAVLTIQSKQRVFDYTKDLLHKRFQKGAKVGYNDRRSALPNNFQKRTSVNTTPKLELTPLIEKAEICGDLSALNCYKECVSNMIIHGRESHRPYLVTLLCKIGKAMEKIESNLNNNKMTAEEILKALSQGGAQIGQFVYQTGDHAVAEYNANGKKEDEHPFVDATEIKDGKGNDTEGETDDKEDEPTPLKPAKSLTERATVNPSVRTELKQKTGGSDRDTAASLKGNDSKKEEEAEVVMLDGKPIDPLLVKIFKGIASKTGKGQSYTWGNIFQACVRMGYISKDTSLRNFSRKVEAVTGISWETVRDQGRHIYDERDKNSIDAICSEIYNILNP